MLATLWYTGRYSFTDYRDYSRLEKELAQTRQKLDTADQERLRFQRERAALQAQLPVAKTEYYKRSKEVRDSLPQLSLTLLKQLDDEPPKEDYGAYFERVKALQAIGTYYATRAKTGKTLREECWVLAREIESEEPELSNVLQQVIPSASVEALESLKPVLEQMKKQVEKKPVPDEIQDQLSSLEKSVEGVRDYSYRLIPSRLLEFARNLIKLPAPAKENALRKKTVEEIVKLINEYLRL